MIATSVPRRVEVAVVGMAYLFTAALFGCSGDSAPSKGGASASANTTPAAAAGEALATPMAAAAQPKPSSDDGESVTLNTCDGANTVSVAKDLKGQPLADALMSQWKRDHPEANWVAAEKEKHATKSPADNSALLRGEQGKGHTYGNFTELDLITWARETEKFVAEGSRIFHDADALGSTVAVSCDMCHPHAANTHPETYPKFQVQLGRVALLRDMIDWCVEQPVRGKHLDPNGPTMRALEAYILSERQGVPLNFGKH